MLCPSKSLTNSDEEKKPTLIFWPNLPAAFAIHNGSGWRVGSFL